MNTLIKLLAVLLITPMIFYSCSPKIIQSNVQKVYYPEIEDSAKIQFLATFNSSTDIEAKQSAFNKSIIGEVDQVKIKKPYGVDYFEGKIFVCDLGIGGIVEIDLKSNKFNQIVPRGPGKLDVPLNISIDELGTIYIVDISLQKILVYDKDFNFISSFGKGELKSPTDIAIINNKIWVTDIVSHTVKVFDKKTNELLFSFPDTVEGNEDWLYKPSNISASKKYIYVTDVGDGGIKKFSIKGDFISKVGSFGKAYGQFVRPKGNAVDKEDNLYVVDGSFQNVQMFNDKNQLLMYFGGPTNTSGGMYLPTGISISYDTELFKKYVDLDKFDLKYLIFQINQFGNHKVNVYGRVEHK